MAEQNPTPPRPVAYMSPEVSRQRLAFVPIDVGMMLLCIGVVVGVGLWLGMAVSLMIFGALLANHLAACLVLCSIDDDERSLFRWVSSSPSMFAELLVMQAWPVVAWLWRGRDGITS